MCNVILTAVTTKVDEGNDSVAELLMPIGAEEQNSLFRVIVHSLDLPIWELGLCISRREPHD